MTNPLDPWGPLIEELKIFRPGPNSNLPPETHLSLESYLMQEKDDHKLIGCILNAGKRQKKQGFLHEFNRIASPKVSKSYRLMKKSPSTNQNHEAPNSAEKKYERSCNSIAKETFRQLAGDYGWLNLQGKSLESALLQEGVPLTLFNRLTSLDEDIPAMLSTIRRQLLIETPPERNFDKLCNEYFECFYFDHYEANADCIDKLILKEYFKQLRSGGEAYLKPSGFYVETAYFGQVIQSNSFYNLWKKIVDESLLQRKTDSKKIKNLKNKEFNLIWDSFFNPAPLSTNEKREIKKRFPDTDERIYNEPGYEFIRMVAGNMAAVNLYFILTLHHFFVERKDSHSSGVDTITKHTLTTNFNEHATYLSKRFNSFLNSNDVDGIKAIMPVAANLSSCMPLSGYQQFNNRFEKLFRDDIFGVALKYADQNNNQDLITHCLSGLHSMGAMNAFVVNWSKLRTLGKKYLRKADFKSPLSDFKFFYD